MSHNEFLRIRSYEERYRSHVHEGRSFSPRSRIGHARGLPAGPGVLELDNIEENLLLAQVFRRACRQTRMHPHKSNTSNRDEPEVLISSVPTVKSNLRVIALAVPSNGATPERER